MDVALPSYRGAELLEQAEDFVRRCYAELDEEEAIESRLAEIRAEIEETGTYEHTVEELEHGARMAWRNNPRCIGRLYWKSLEVIDERDTDTAEGVFDAICRHLEYAREGGDVRPVVTIFPPAVDGDLRVRIWNYQAIRYAGYETENGIVGDPDEVDITAYCQSRGWEGPGTDFDVLPLVIQTARGVEQPDLFDLPENLVVRVPMSHPEYDWFGDLGLEWYDIPVISNLRLEIGGLQYTAAPFNGWYVASEIAARNFADEHRYDVVPEVGERMGLDTSRSRSLWKDEVIVELNRAVLHSYDEAGVKIFDHHTAAEQFELFENREKAAGREVAGSWEWLIPPISPATTHIFHQQYDDTMRTPNFFYPPAPY